MTSFALKIIACISMFLDHLSYGLFGKMSWLNYVGRLAFPIFAFQISEGYTHTKNLRKYFLRLVIFAFVSQIPFALFCSISSEKISLNVFFTLLLGLFCIFIWDKLTNRFIGVCTIIFACLAAEVTNMDYGYWGVLLVFVFYLCKNNKPAILLSFIILLLLKYLPYILQYNFYYKYILLFLGTFFSIFPILFYNRKQGRKIKYFLYIFYPVHLVFLYILYHIIH